MAIDGKIGISGPKISTVDVISYSSHSDCHSTVTAARSVLFENSLGDVVIVSIPLEVESSAG